MKYAENGKAFYSVITPGVAVEFELPTIDAEYTDDDRRNWETLEETAERYRAPITCFPYERL